MEPGAAVSESTAPSNEPTPNSAHDLNSGASEKAFFPPGMVGAAEPKNQVIEKAQAGGVVGEVSPVAPEGVSPVATGSAPLTPGGKTAAQGGGDSGQPGPTEALSPPGMGPPGIFPTPGVEQSPQGSATSPTAGSPGRGAAQAEVESARRSRRKLEKARRRAAEAAAKRARALSEAAQKAEVTRVAEAAMKKEAAAAAKAVLDGARLLVSG